MSSYIQFLLHYFSQHPGELIILIIGRLVLYFIEIVLLSTLASRVVQSSEAPQQQNLLSSTSLFIALFILASILWFVIENFNATVIPNVQEYVRNTIVTSTIDDASPMMDTVDTGTSISNLIRIPQLVYMEMIAISFYVFPFIFTFLFLAFYFFRFGHLIGSLFIISIIILLVVYGFWFQMVVDIAKERYQKEVELTDAMNNILYNIEPIVNENLKDQVIQDFQLKQTDYSEALYKELMNMNGWKQTLDIWIMLLNGVLIGTGLWLYTRNRLSLTLLGALVAVIIFVINRMISLIHRIGDLPFTLGGISVCEQQIQLVMQSLAKKIPLTTTTPPPRLASKDSLTIRIEHIGFRYAPSLPWVLHDVNMTLFPGTSHVIQGHSGAGKTTLFRCLMGYFPLTQGKITINHVPIETYEIQEIRQHFTIMTQNGFLFDTTVLENISRSPDDHMILRSMPIYDRIVPMLSRQVGKLGCRLSGGERQMVLLLRAYFRPSSLLLLDEPTSNIDKQTKTLIVDILRYLIQSGRTVLCITHDESIISLFQYHYRLIDGRLEIKNDAFE